MARDFYQLDEAQRVALLHQRIHQRLIAQQQLQQHSLQQQASHDSNSLTTTATTTTPHGPLAPTSSNSDWWGCDNLLCNFLSKYSVSKTTGKAFAGLCCVGACIAVELAVLADGAQHHFEEMYHASTCLFNFTLVLLLYWLVVYRRHKDWLNLILVNPPLSTTTQQDISVSLLAGGLILGPTILLYNSTFAEPDEYLKALTPQPQHQTATTTTRQHASHYHSNSRTSSSSTTTTSTTTAASLLLSTNNAYQQHSSSPFMLPLSAAYDHAYMGGGLAYDNRHPHSPHHNRNNNNNTSLLFPQPHQRNIVVFDVPPKSSLSSSASSHHHYSAYDNDDDDNYSSSSTADPLVVASTELERDDDDNEQQVLTGVNLIGAAGLKCHGTASFSITHANEVQFCAGMLTAVACGFAAFLGFIINAIHVILADTRGEYLLQPGMNSNDLKNNTNRSRPGGSHGATRHQHLPVRTAATITLQRRPPALSARHTAAAVSSALLQSTPKSSSNNLVAAASASHGEAAKLEEEEAAATELKSKSSKSVFLHPNYYAGGRTTISDSIGDNSAPPNLQASDTSLRSVDSGRADDERGDEHCKLNQCLSYASILSAPTPL